MDYPILDGNETIGTLTVREEGLYRVLSARIAPRPGVQRLWLCGKTGHTCLGVLVPDGGALVWQKRFSRLAWDALPQPLVCAALSEPQAPASNPAPPSPAPGFAPPPAPASPQGAEDARCLRLFGQRFIVFRS